MWGEEPYNVWRNLESVKLAATQSCTSRRCTPRVRGLMQNMMEPFLAEKLEKEIWLKGNPDNNSSMRFNSLNIILKSFTTILAHHTNPYWNRNRNYDSKYLRLYIANYFEYVDTGTSTSHHRALSNVIPFVNYAMQQIGRYCLLTTIYKRNPSVESSHQGIVDPRSTLFDPYYLTKHAEDYHGKAFLHYMNISHRVKNLLAIGLLDKELIHNLLSTSGTWAHHNNIKIVSRTKKPHKVYRMFATPKQYLRLAKEPEVVLPNPFTEQELLPEDVDEIREVLFQNGYLASLMVRQIAQDLELIFKETKPKPVGLPKKLIQCKSWTKIHCLGRNQETRVLFLNIKHIVDYVLKLN